jgi:phage-related protein
MAAVIKIQVETTGGLDAVKRDLDDLGGRAKGAGGGFNALQEMAVGALRHIGTIGVDLALQGLQKLGGFIGDSISVAGDFQAKMNEVGAALGKGFEPGTEGLNEFKDLFISLGKELPVSTAEVQDAALALVKGGLDPAVIKAGALEDSLKFAAAAGMELADAAELTIKQLGTFVPLGASVEEQTKFMAEAQDLLVKAAGASTLNVDKLGDAMLQAGGAAKATGVDYKDFVTTMGLISPSFGSAAEAGTQFKNFVSLLVPTTKNATEQMDKLGLMTTSTTKIMKFLQERGIQPLGTDLDTLGNQFTELMVAQGQTAEETGKIWDTFSQSRFFDMDGKFIGMRDSAELLKNAFVGLSDAERTEAMKAIFGNDAKAAAIALMDAGAAGYDAFAQKMEAANGVQAQAAATQQGFNFQLENMKGSLEALQITIGTALLPVLSDLIGNYITPGINKVMELADAFLNGGGATSMMGEATAVLQGWWAALQPALLEVWRVLQTQVWPILQDLGTALLPLVGAAIQIFAGFWSDVLVPAIQMLWEILTTIVLPVLAVLASWLAEYLPPAIQFVADFLTNILFPALHTVYDFITTYVIPLFAALVDLHMAALGFAVQTLANFWTGTLLPAINSVWSFITTYVIPLFNALVQLHMATLGLAVRTLAGIWSEVLWPALNKVWAFIQTYLGPVINWLDVQILQPLMQILSDIFMTVVGSVLPVLTKLSSLVKDEVSKAFNNLNSYAGAAAGGLSKIGEAVRGVIQWISDLASKLNSISIPDWLEGHSPPPMADWFSYVADSVAAVNAQLPELQMNLAGALPGGGGGGNTSYANSRSFTYAPTQYINGGASAPMDLALATSLAGV